MNTEEKLYEALTNILLQLTNKPMGKLLLTEVESEVYRKIIANETMDVMFNFAYLIGRDRAVKEGLEIIERGQKYFNSEDSVVMEKDAINSGTSYNGIYKNERIS